VTTINGNPFDAIREAVNEARVIQRAVDKSATDLAWLLEGRLRHVSPDLVKRLKRELRDFNMHTGRWGS